MKPKSEVYVAEPSPEPFSLSSHWCLKTPRNFLLATMCIPILPCHLPEVNCLYARCPPLTPTPASRQNDIYLYTDDINMPATVLLS